MKKKITLQRIFHHEKWYLALVFGYDSELVSVVKTVNGARWSNTNSCWLADDDEITLKQILNVFREKADIDISAIVSKNRTPDKVEKQPHVKDVSPIIPEPVADKSVQGPDESDIPEKAGSLVSSSVEFNINEEDGRLSVRFEGHCQASWINELQDFGHATFDRVSREWFLPWSQITVDSLSDYFSSQGVVVIVNKRKLPLLIKKEREGTGSGIRERELRSEALLGLDLVRDHLTARRYSSRTIKTYLAVLSQFFKFYHEKDPKSITRKEVSVFMHEYVLGLSYSPSYQNQIISAIKIFYELTGKGRIDTRGWDRPKRSRALPKVFSKEEVMKILGAARNMKHRLILWLIYSCGLRRSEVINIKLSDLDRERGILHIREGKGKVDRIVPVPGKVWDKIDGYIKSYTPKLYLIEGQGGGKYSAESVYSVFKQSLRRTGIKKDLGVHCLRHSYATHLHEGGLDIRFIQELLGHKSTRTTEVYTHVSRRNLFSVRSPIEDMDLD